MEPIERTLGRRVRQLRMSMGWTQEELAARCGKHWTYIGGIERGERNPTLRVLASLAKAFSIPLARLLSFRKDGKRL
jgi:transcriptional regulator with XRE-family HTH domain